MNRCKRLLMIQLLILLSVAGLTAQVNQKQILLNQARRYQATRDFYRALEMYEELMRRFSDDSTVVEGYFNILITLNRSDEAEAVLEEYKAVFAEEEYLIHKILLLLRKGEIEQARRIGLDYLDLRSEVINLYKDFAAVYEAGRDYETAVEVLLKGRNIAQDENLFALELARNYEYLQKWSLSISEYAKHLDRNPGFINFVTDRVKGILDQDETIISSLQREVSQRENLALTELYALALAHIASYEKAFAVYRELDPEKLLAFADELYAAGNLELAKKAYQETMQRIQDPVKSADVGIKLAQLYISSNLLEEARQALLTISEDENIQQRQIRYRTRANRVARELLANISIRAGDEDEEIVRWYNEAKQYAFNNNERKEIDLKAVHYFIMSGNSAEAYRRLNLTLQGESSGSHITNISHYYRFMMELMQDNTASDSLLTELVIAIPGSEFTNETLFLTLILEDMPVSVREVFLEAYRLKNIYRDEEALELLVNLERGQLTEQMIVIASEWAEELGDYELAAELLTYNFRDETIRGYATFKLAELMKEDNDEYRPLLTTFLTEHPIHILAPRFRQILSTQSTGRATRQD